MGVLSNKQWEKFSQLYAIHFNGTQAATDSGYSKRTAGAQANALLKNPKVRKRIDEINEERFSELKMSLRPRIIEELAAIAFNDVTEIVRVREEMETDPKTKKKRRKLIVEITDTTKVGNHKAISSIWQTKDGVKISFYDKTKALHTLSEITGIKKEQIEIANVNLVIDKDDEKL